MAPSGLRLFLQAVQPRADGGGKRGVFGNDIVDAVQLFKQLEIRDRLGQGGHGPGQHHGLGVTALAGQHRHGADGLEHQIHHAGRQVRGSGVLRQIAEVGGSHIRVQSGSGVDRDVLHGQGPHGPGCRSPPAF